MLGGVKRASATGAALIILLTFVAYIPAIRGGFLWDDAPLITENRLVKASDGLYRFWCTTEAPDYYPATWSLWWLEWRLWGENPAGYHMLNVLLHAINAVLVWMVLSRLKIPGAWAAGLVFAIHPVNVATVAWVSEQKNTLSMLFYLIAILSYLRFDEQGRWRWYGLSWVAFLLALLSKSAVVMLPVVLLGCVWWMRGRVRWQEVLRSVPFFFLSLIFGLVAVWFQYHQVLTKGFGVRTMSFGSRLIVAGWVPWFYLSKALVPVDLMVIYPKWDPNASSLVAYAPGIMLMGCFFMFWRKRRTWGRPFLFGIGYFVGTLFPVLGFLDQAFFVASLVADHWQYYSIVGVIALVVALGGRLCSRIDTQRRGMDLVVGMAIVAVLSVTTWRRSRVYATDESLWQDNVTKNPSAWLAHCNLGVALGQAGRVPEAIEHYKHALWVKPDYAEAHVNLGVALQLEGKTPEAIGHFEQALRIRPNMPGAHYNLGVALQLTGKMGEAITQYEQGLQINPDNAELHHSLGFALQQAGRIQQATEHWEIALRIKPDYAEAHYNLGVACVQQGRAQEAIDHWVQALQIKPEYAEAHYNLGVACVQQGRSAEAISHWEAAVRINPDYAEAHYNLAVALEQQGRVQDALSHYREALRIKPNHREAQDQLARVQGMK